nr:DUF2796 domain-containing protein [Pleionea sp. CnH1-48]
MLIPIYALDNTENLTSHEHGSSELTIVIEKQSVEIELISPAANLVGFEHVATRKEDINKVHKAVADLRQHDTLLLLSGGHCAHKDTSIELNGLISEKQHHHHNKSAHDHSHTHNHTHSHDHKHANKHNDIVAHYRYHCEESSLQSLSLTNLFKSFPGINEVKVMWVKPTKQGADKLSLKDPMVRFK